MYADTISPRAGCAHAAPDGEPPLIVYLDAGGHERDQTHVVVAGFAARRDAWARFARVWRARLASDDLECFHAVEFAQSVGAFAGWRDDERRRRALARDLMRLVQAHAELKCATAVRMDHLHAYLPETTRKAHGLNALAIAARACVHDIAQSTRSRRTLAFVFESGDCGGDRLSRLLESDGYGRPIFKAKRCRAGADFSATPLQAADWLAYEMFQLVKRRIASPLTTDIRWPLQSEQFGRVGGTLGVYGPERLRALAREIGGEERSTPPRGEGDGSGAWSIDARIACGGVSHIWSATPIFEAPARGSHDNE